MRVLPDCELLDRAGAQGIAVSEVRAYVVFADAQALVSWMLSLCMVADRGFTNGLLLSLRLLSAYWSGGE